MLGRGLLAIEDLEREDIELILDTATKMKEVGERDVKKVPTLRGRTIINLFFESSTRTRTSFEIAGKRLSADVVNFSPSSSSLTKSESILDTAKTLDAMDPAAVVIRHTVSGVPKPSHKSSLNMSSWTAKKGEPIGHCSAKEATSTATFFVGSRCR